MTTSDIELHIQDIYGLDCSDTTISRIVDKIPTAVKEGQSRLIKAMYEGVFSWEIEESLYRC